MLTTNSDLSLIHFFAVIVQLFVSLKASFKRHTHTTTVLAWFLKTWAVETPSILGRNNFWSRKKLYIAKAAVAFPLVQNRLTHTLEVVIVFQVCNKKKKTSYCEHLVPWHNYVYCVSTMTKQKVFNQLWLKATTTHYLDGWITRVDPPRVAVVRFR